MRPNGHVAEWLRSGLQNRLPRFNSGRGLQASVAKRVEAGQMVRGGLCGLGKPRFDTLGRFQRRNGFVICGFRRASRLFPGSSAVEQPAVNRLVAGSNPARGATSIKVRSGRGLSGDEVYSEERGSSFSREGHNPFNARFSKRPAAAVARRRSGIKRASAEKARPLAFLPQGPESQRRESVIS